MDGPRLVCGTPKVSLIVYFIGVGLSIFWLLILPFLFPFYILGLFAMWIINLALNFDFVFSFSWR